MYDEAGHLISEYGVTNPIEDTVWMGDIPVAVIQKSGGSFVVYYVHTDHLNTPRKVTRPSDNALMWRWDPDTYGMPQPNSNPSGLGTFTFNQRFAGQYFMNESWMFMNYYRAYNPQQGRYLEADPIGLAGGINTYAYVHGNPVSRRDPLGLDDSICQFNPGMCGMQGNANPNEPSALVEMMVAEGAIVTALIAPEAVAALERALSLTPKGLPPPGTRPPVANPEQCKVGPSTRGDGSSAWDSNGGEWRYAPEDQWHNPHWDYNPWENWNAPWQNVPIDGLPPVKPGP